MNSKNKLLFYLVLVILFILIILYNFKFKLYNYDSFLISNLLDKPNQSMERTKLYGSIFLDNLDSVITNMTNPPINYDTKRIEIIKYNDILL